MQGNAYQEVLGPFRAKRKQLTLVVFKQYSGTSLWTAIRKIISSKTKRRAYISDMPTKRTTRSPRIQIIVSGGISGRENMRDRICESCYSRCAIGQTNVNLASGSRLHVPGISWAAEVRGGTAVDSNVSLMLRGILTCRGILPTPSTLDRLRSLFGVVIRLLTHSPLVQVLVATLFRTMILLSFTVLDRVYCLSDQCDFGSPSQLVSP